MCVLTDAALREQLANGFLVVLPAPTESQIQPNSIDVTIGRNLLKSNLLGASRDYVYNWRVKPPEPMYVSLQTPYVLPSKQFVLAETTQYIEIPDNLTCTIEGRSSVGRFGLFIVNAGRIDSGYNGTLTLELFNAENFAILLEEGMPIGQLVYSTLCGGVERPYGHPDRNSKYQGAPMVERSRAWMEAPKRDKFGEMLDAYYAPYKE